MADAEIQAGLWAPVEQYALIESARRAAAGHSVEDHLDDVAALWAGFNAVAGTNPLADFPEPRTAEFLRTAGPGNRPLAFPYAKWHVSQWAVDQAGALLLCSAGAARDAGIPVDRWVFPRALVESSLSVSLSRREELHRWPAMGVLGRATAEHLGRPLDQLDLVECYSCFPVAVRVQQAELGLDPLAVPTLTGGMTFAGGPFNNFTYQATAALVGALREDPGAMGLVTTVSGLLTKPGLAVWGAAPSERPPLVADYGTDAAEVTGVRDVTGSGTGAARVVAYTVSYEGDEPNRSFVIADLADGRRWVGVSHHDELVRRGLTEELVGTTVHVDGRECRPA
jgi:acetyl-CoA C-acetyltransferase